MLLVFVMSAAMAVFSWGVSAAGFGLTPEVHPKPWMKKGANADGGWERGQRMNEQDGYEYRKRSKAMFEEEDRSARKEM